MHVVVAGATGATGRLVVDRATAAGHRVTAVVRDARRYGAPPGVDVLAAEVVTGRRLDLPAGADVVISTLGKRSFQDTVPVCEAGVANLLVAMERRGIRRIVAVSASPVLRSGAGEPWWFRRTVRPYVRRTGRRVYADLEAMEDVLRGSGDAADWTIVRPGYLVDKPPTEYEMKRGANAMGSVHRPDLAAALLEVASDASTVGSAYGLASRPRRARTGAAPSRTGA